MFAFLAVLALLVSPVTAATAQAACGHGAASAMPGMDMPAKAGRVGADAARSGGDPCCDPANHQDKKAGSSCAQMCAAACAATAALPAAPVSFTHVHVRAPLSPARLASVQSFRPSGPRRPPKSIA